MTTETERRHKAEQQRRYRRRRRLGLRVYGIELDNYHIRQLKQAGLIDDDILADRDATAEALGDAIEQLLAAALDGWSVPRSSFLEDFKGTHTMAPPGHRKPKEPKDNSNHFWRPSSDKA